MRTTTRRRRVMMTTLLLLVAQATAHSGRASADPPTSVSPSNPADTPARAEAAVPTGTPAARAAALEKRGETRFTAEDYAAALADFTAAEELAPAAWHQWYIGHSQDHLGHFHEAVAAYAKLTAAAPASLGKVARDLPEASERTAAIKAMPGEIHLEATPASVVVTVDGAEQTGTTPFDLKLAPGAHSLRLSAPGYETETADLDVTYASKRTVSLMLHEVPAPAPATVPPPPTVEAPTTPPPPRVTRSTLGWAAGGLALVGAGFGTAFGIVALQSNSSFNDVHTLGRAYRAQDFAVYSDVSFGAAVALGVTSAVLLLGGHDAPDPAAAQARARKPSAFSIQASPISVPHGGGAGALVRF